MTRLTRREMLKAAGAGAALLTVPSLTLAADEKPMLFELPKLPYAFDALEPHIDARTMEIHHGRHHQAYVDNLNKALAGTEWQGKDLATILASLDKLPEAKRGAVRNNGGGHWNHSFFWLVMSPKGGKPAGPVSDAITASFGDLDKMLAQLKAAALARFGSGWGWVVAGKDGKLKVVSSANQDNSLMDGGGTPILGIDVWEHAYYLKYQNKRADYIDAFFKVINWETVGQHFAEATKKS
jgi:Fe-Mn family superoxide dismutase